MKRSAALVTGLLLLLAAPIAVGMFVKTKCPDCAAVRSKEQSAAPGFVNPGCPRCSDLGEVAWLSRFTRRPMDPDLARLFRACWDPSDIQLPSRPLLRALAARSGLDTEIDPESTCEAFFVHTNEDPLVAVASHPWNPDRHVWTLVLFDLDGAVLDLLRISYPGKHAERPGIWTTTSQLDHRTFTLSRPGVKGLRFALSGSSGKRDLDGDALEIRIIGRRFDAVVRIAPP